VKVNDVLLPPSLGACDGDADPDLEVLAAGLREELARLAPSLGSRQKVEQQRYLCGGRFNSGR